MEGVGLLDPPLEVGGHAAGLATRVVGLGGGLELGTKQRPVRARDLASHGLIADAVEQPPLDDAQHLVAGHRRPTGVDPCRDVLERVEQSLLLHRLAHARL